jgi:hypothetical protein
MSVHKVALNNLSPSIYSATLYLNVENPDKLNSLFKFQYLPDFSKFILENKLDEFVTVGIRFCREMNLPMMRALEKFSEEQLIEISREGNRELLDCLSKNEVLSLIQRNIQNFLNNQIKDYKGNTLLDKSDVLAEDIILGMFIRRKLFNFFLHSYTKNAVLHMLIAAEVDFYTTQEQLMTSKAMIAKNQATLDIDSQKNE